MTTKIINGKIILTDEILDGYSLYFADGIITAVTTDDLPCDTVIDAAGQYVSPGFIDIHTHGAGGADFLDGTAEAYRTAAKMHGDHGTTTLLPTTTSVDRDGILVAVKAYEEARQTPGLPDMPGLHLEGPNLAASQKGAQEERFIHPFDQQETLDILNSTDRILRWTAAPELEGAEWFGDLCMERGVLPCIGHTEANYFDVVRTLPHGFTHVTHLYSCTPSITRKNAYRIAGVLEAAYLLDDMTVEIIADGSHLPAELLKFVYKFKGREKTALVTDSMRAAGMPEGESVLGKWDNGLPVIVEDGVAKLLDRTAFAGSVATCDRLVRTMRDLAEIPLHDAVYMMTKSPADIMNFDDRGVLEPGKRADIVLFDETVNVSRTIVAGETIFSA
ncbi:MAG: N-acetylglucosamine-6-phosphate deacetylase [Ruminococcaceae bacterium]|nr:N-acetylglucosamine-6-phosphate deacetylase [Oscillospiraceae bacterium]